MRQPFFLALFVIAAACSSAAHQPVLRVSRLQISDEILGELARGEHGLGLDPGQLHQHLVEALDATGRFQPQVPVEGLKPTGKEKDKGSLSYRVRVEVGFAREGDEPPPGWSSDGGSAAGAPAGSTTASAPGLPLRHAEIGLTMTLAPVGAELETLRAEASATRLFDPGAAPLSRTRAFQAALDQALRQAARELVFDVDAQGESDAALIAQAQSTDGGLREVALRQLIERKNPAAVPALIERLKDPDRDVVLRTVGALEAIRDQRAVRPLIELTERQDPSFVSQVIYVIGAIGGRDAEAFLFTLQNGSPEPQVRLAASEAALELHKRQHAQGQGESTTAATKPTEHP